MTRDVFEIPDWDISSQAEFETALQTLLFEALDTDLDIRGVWEYRHDQAYPDLEVFVTELAEEN